MVRWFQMGDIDIAWEIATQSIPNLPGSDVVMEMFSISIGHPDPVIREAAVYAMSWPPHPSDEETEELRFRSLQCVLTNEQELPRVRGQAAEGIHNMFDAADRRKRRFRKAKETLLEVIEFDDPDVRFWCCFALGGMKDPAVLPVLRRIARTDKRMCPGWWRVCDEAKDAIATIEGRRSPLRKCIPEETP